TSLTFPYTTLFRSGFDADVREPRALHGEIRPGDRQGAVRVQGPRRTRPRPAARIHGLHPAVLRLQPPEPAEAPQAVYDRERVPVRGAAEGPVPRVLAAERGDHRRRGAALRRGGARPRDRDDAGDRA